MGERGRECGVWGARQWKIAGQRQPPWESDKRLKKLWGVWGRSHRYLGEEPGNSTWEGPGVEMSLTL